MWLINDSDWSAKILTNINQNIFFPSSAICHTQHNTSPGFSSSVSPCWCNCSFPVFICGYLLPSIRTNVHLHRPRSSPWNHGAVQLSWVRNLCCAVLEENDENNGIQINSSNPALHHHHQLLWRWDGNIYPKLFFNLCFSVGQTVFLWRFAPFGVWSVVSCLLLICGSPVLVVLREKRGKIKYCEPSSTRSTLPENIPVSGGCEMLWILH